MSQYNNPPTQGGNQQPNGAQPGYQQNPYGQPTGYTQNPYQQPSYRQAPYGQPTGYQQPQATPPYVAQSVQVVQPAQNQMTLGNWLVTMLVLSIPLVGFIMLLVWAFGGSDQPSRKTYCQATLLWGVIAIVLVILIMLIFGASLGAIMSSLN